MQKAKLQEDLKESMKARNELKTSVLRMLLSAIKSYEMTKIQEEYDKKLEEVGEEAADTIEVNSAYEASEKDVEEVIQKQVKQRRDSIEQYKAGNRQDLADKEEKELAILQTYLPAQMGEEEIKKLVDEAIAQTGAKGMTDMGKVMDVLMPKVKGKADGNLVSQTVKSKLSKSST